MTEFNVAKGEPRNINWGVNAQTGVLTDVLLGKPDHFDGFR